MNAYLEKHSGIDFVTYLKVNMKRKEKVKSGKQEKRTKKEGKDDDEKRRLMKIEVEARGSLIRKQEQLTSSLLLLRRSPVVKRVTLRTITYFRPPQPSPTPPPPQLQHRSCPCGQIRRPAV